MISIILIIALFLGILAGTLTGLFPGIHINLVAVLILSSSFLLEFEAIAIVIFLVAMAITHTFVDYLPSIFLGAPDEDNFLSILPGHNMLLKGRGYNAVVYTLYGSVAALIIILLISPFFIFYLNDIYPIINNFIPYILILASLLLIYSEKNSRILAGIIFFLSGFLGIATFNMPIENYMLPLFTGLFGISSLLTSITKNQEIPKQRVSKIRNIKIKRKSLIKSLSASIISAPLVSFLPGLGSSQAAIIGSQTIGKLNQKEFLVLLGAINTIVMGLSFIALYSINVARTGTAVAIQKIIILNFAQLLYLLGTIIIAGIISFFITIYLAKYFARNIHKVNYKILSSTIITILIILTIYFSGFLGLLILIVSSILGYTTILLGIKRTHLMGSLLLPIILYYLL